MASTISRLLMEIKLAKNRIGINSRAADGGLCQWGIVGTGYMGEQFARYLGQTEGSNIKAVCSRSVEKGRRFARRHAAAASYSDIGQMVESESGELDIVYVATPVDAHFEIARWCLEAGINVLCEKPLCATLRESKELFSVADASGAQLFEGMWMRCLPTLRQADEWIAAGSIGHVTHIRASIQKGEQGGEPSCLLDFGAYALAFASEFVGAGRALATVRVERDSNGDDRRWDIVLSGANLPTARIVLSTLNEGDSSAVIEGDGGFIRIPSQFNRADSVELYDGSGSLVEKRRFNYVHCGFEHEIADVSRAVKRGSSSKLGKKATLRAIALMDAFYSSKGEFFESEIELQ